MDSLRKSIDHWRNNVAAETPDDASTASFHCALCQAYPDKHCTGCPVKAKTGQAQCRGTPYYEAHRKLLLWRHHPEMKEHWRQAAQDMLNFLEELNNDVD